MDVKDLNRYFADIADYNDLDKDKIAGILSKAITFNTVSYEDTSLMDGEAFKGLHRHFEESFPLVHQAMDKTVLNEWTLLYRWKGSDTSLKPGLFMSHLDVVPVMPGTEGDWNYPPFSGEIVDGCIWGRGTIDTKGMVVGELSAAEYLLSKGFQPKRDIYFVFGHDEETMGVDGSLAAMEHLKKAGIQLEFVMDEGGGFKNGDDYGAKGQLLARIEVFEKGYIDVAVEANAKGGHSSAPGKGTALGKVARAIAAIEENQLSPNLNPVAEEMFKALGPVITEEPFKTYVNNLEENKKELAQYLSSIDKLAPLVQTTTALTMINGSPAPNVLPQKVKAVINFRISAEDTCDSVLRHCKGIAAQSAQQHDNGSELNIYMTKGMDPSKISKTDSPAFTAMKEATNKFIPEAIVVPGLSVGGTDCRYFEDICDCCYRYRPYIDSIALGHTTHATNEHCSIDALLQGVKIITDVMVKMCF